MNTKMKISMDCDNIIAKVIQDYIKKQQSDIDIYKSSHITMEQEIKELETVMFTRETLELHHFRKISNLRVIMKDDIKEIEQFKARIQDNENLLAMFIEYDFHFLRILRNKLMTLKKSLKLIINSVVYIFRHYRKSPTHEYQSVFNLILATMCELDVSKPIILTQSRLKENYERCLKIEEKNIDASDASLIYGKKSGNVFFEPNVYDVAIEIERLSDRLTNFCGDMSDTSLGRQLYFWLYITVRIILRKSMRIK